LLGIKGYCTNLPESRLSAQQAIERYHHLWRVEQSFYGKHIVMQSYHRHLLEVA